MASSLEMTPQSTEVQCHPEVYRLSCRVGPPHRTMLGTRLLPAGGSEEQRGQGQPHTWGQEHAQTHWASAAEPGASKGAVTAPQAISVPGLQSRDGMLPPQLKKLSPPRTWRVPFLDGKPLLMSLMVRPESPLASRLPPSAWAGPPPGVRKPRLTTCPLDLNSISVFSKRCRDYGGRSLGFISLTLYITLKWE